MADRVTILNSITTRVLAIVVLLSLVAAAVGLVGVDTMRVFHQQSLELDRARTRELLGERVNLLIYQSVMDSRGIYMAVDHADAEKYAPLVLNTIAKLPEVMAEWTSLIDPQDAPGMVRANARVAEYIAFRTELVRLSRTGRPQHGGAAHGARPVGPHRDLAPRAAAWPGRRRQRAGAPARRLLRGHAGDDAGAALDGGDAAPGRGQHGGRRARAVPARRIG